MSDESKKITNLVIDALVIGAGAIGVASIGNAITPKLPKPKLAITPYDHQGIFYIFLLAGTYARFFITQKYCLG